MSGKLFPVLLALLWIFFVPSSPVTAQESGAIYIVQPGDTLWGIAVRFNIPLSELMRANGLTENSALFPGQQLILPGLEGVNGILTTQIVGLGDTLRSLARRYQTSLAVLQRLNRLISPSQLYVGSNLILPQSDSVLPLTSADVLGPEETLLELAVRHHTDVWTLTILNGLTGPWAALPGDPLYASNRTEEQAGGLPPAFFHPRIKALPLKQGGTAIIIVETAPGTTLSGMLVDRPLRFFETDHNHQVALQGIHALIEPGIYPLRLEATLPNGSRQSFEQMVLVVSGNYPTTSLYVDPATLDPALNEAETQRILKVTAAVTPQRYWQEPFRLPVDSQYCITDWFGARRSYNAGRYTSFHSGVDYGICSETHPFDIYAPAPGVVVLAEELTIRGKVTVIDHGWGIYSGFWHQEEIYVSVGEQVYTGQLIGKIGGTGRVTGPHLHWELWVNGVQVDPLDWLDQWIP